MEGREQGVDQALQTAMLRDGFDYNGDPGIIVMLTGDGAGFDDGVGFHADMERMHRAAGALKRYRGDTVATAGCESGWKRTASSSHWMIFTTASPI